MILKDIMVHVDTTPSCKTRLEAAAALARRQGATLTGLYVYSAPRLEFHGQRPETVRQKLFAPFEQKGLATEWLPVELGSTKTSVAEMVAYHACFTDLLVISQPSVGRTRADRHDELAGPERILLGSGRPVLIVPRTGQFPHIGERIMVAWKAGPKASRALYGALPLLQGANHVSLVSVGGDGFRANEAELLGSYLAKHTVKSRLEKIPEGDLSIGDTLLNLVADEGIDLLVLGVHVLSRRGQLDMGEVARYLLGQMTVPMLLSH